MKMTTITIPGIADTRTNDGYYAFNIFTRDMVVATRGVMELAEKHQCYWLLDVIASYLPKAVKMGADYMLIATVKVNLKKQSCVFTLEDEQNGEKRLIAKQRIPYTDLAIEELKIWIINEDVTRPFSFATRSIVLLPSEY